MSVHASELRAAIWAVIGYWDSLDTVGSNDSRPTSEFANEMDKRIGKLRDVATQYDQRIEALIKSVLGRADGGGNG